MKMQFGGETSTKIRRDIPYSGRESNISKTINIEEIKLNIEERANYYQAQIKNIASRNINELALNEAKKRYEKENPNANFNALNAEETKKLREKQLDGILTNRVKNDSLNK